jgi:glycosyltransferase involved in cell wall biosynthesis
MRILFLARTLRMGGAERQLVALARGLHRSGHRVGVAVFYAGGEFEAELRLDGVPVHDLAKRGRWDNLAFLVRLCLLVRRERPDIVHSYLDSPNIVAAALKRFFPSVKVVWGIRSAMDDLRAYGWLDTVSAGIERLASPLADGIIANSEAGRRHALAIGLDSRHLVVIPNGIDCDAFRPDEMARERVRREWRVPPDSPLVGMVARLDPVKGHPNFLRAAATVAASQPAVRFACVGGGQPAYRRELEELARGLGLAQRLTWVGERRATRAEYSALDVAVLSSDEGEGFPNVLAEAMACGRPVVATDSGDARLIVGETGVVVPSRDPDALARGILDVLERIRRSGPELSSAARAHIERHFSVAALVDQTVHALEHVRAGASAASVAPQLRTGG